MTFDEAIEKIDELQGSAGYATCGVPEANNFSGYDVHEYLNAATEIINNLHEEYAPIAEMTKEQYDYIIPLIQQGKELGVTFTEFWEVYKFTGASKKIKPAFNSQEQAMQVWLHPETIKVIGENDDTATSSRNRD